MPLDIEASKDQRSSVEEFVSNEYITDWRNLIFLPFHAKWSFVIHLTILLASSLTVYDLVVPEVLQSRLSTDPTYSFDLIAECTGSAEAVDSVLPMVKNGGTLCILGVAPPCSKISVSPYNVYSRELRILGVLIDQFSFASAVNLAEALGNRYLDFCKLGVKCYELKDYCKAFEDVKCGGISKAVFKFP